MKTWQAYIDVIKKYRTYRNLSNLVSGDKNRVEQLKIQVDSLNLNFPTGYQNFLEMCDGFDSFGILIYSIGTRDSIRPGVKVPGFIEVNTILKEEYNCNHTFFGEKGMENFIYHNENKKYCVIDGVSFDVLEMFPNFDEMLSFILHQEASDLEDIMKE